MAFKKSLKYSQHPLFWLIVLSIGLYGCAFWWGLPTWQTWAADAISPQSIADPDVWNKDYIHYPPLHRYLLALTYLPLWALHLLDVFDKNTLWGNTLLIGLGRLLSCGMGVGIVIFTYFTAREIFERDRPAVITTLIVVLMMPLVYYSKVVNLEVPYVFWFALSLLGYIRIFKYHHSSDYWLFAITAVLSVTTKDQAYGLYLLPICLVVADCFWHLRQNSRDAKEWRSKLISRLGIPALSGLFLFAVIHGIGFNTDAFVRHVEALKGASYEANEFFVRPENNLTQQVTLAARTVQDMIFCQGWPIFLVCVSGLIWAIFHARNHKLLLSLLLPVVSYHLFFIAVILYSRDRFMIPVCLILSYFGGLLLDRLLTRHARSWLVNLGVICIFSYTFFYAFSVNALMLQDGRYAAEKWLRANLPAGATVGLIGGGFYQVRTYFLPEGTAQKMHTNDLGDCDRLRELDYVMTTSAYDIRRFPPETPQYQNFAALFNHQTVFREVFRSPTEVRWSIIRPEQPTAAEYYDARFKTGNFNKINPEIRIFKRQGVPQCTSEAATS